MSLARICSRRLEVPRRNSQDDVSWHDVLNKQTSACRHELSIDRSTGNSVDIRNPHIVVKTH
jgi:hypothetical protein